MRSINLGACVVGAVLSCMALMQGSDARSDGTSTGPGSIAAVQSDYGNRSADEIETLSTGDAIKSVAASGSMTAIWETLEHGERVECLDCIPAVSPLLYDANPRTREISAWWLRRRMLGVWGPGEVYQQTLTTLSSDADPVRRAKAANAIGEFLAAAGIPAVATALKTDADPGVRAAAASALGRLNDDGAGALGGAMTDSDSGVKLAALGAAGRINTFTATASIAAAIGDADPMVRRRASDVLGELHATDSVAGLLALAQGDGDATVRSSACHSLGMLGDSSVKAQLTAIGQNDKDQFVRDMANQAVRRL